MKEIMRKGDAWCWVMLTGILACFTACEEDNPVPLEEIVKASVKSEVSFDLYSTFDTVNPLSMTLTSSEEATVNYTWYRVDEIKGDSLLYEGKIACRGGADFY